jgi:hypothetical protein
MLSSGSLEPPSNGSEKTQSHKDGGNSEDSRSAVLLVLLVLLLLSILLILILTSIILLIIHRYNSAIIETVQNNGSIKLSAVSLYQVGGVD